MGQRSQIIVLRESEGEIVIQAVYHNQWRYGIGFISTLGEILKVWEKGIKKLDKKNRLYDWQLPNLLERAIDYANVIDFPDICGYSEITSEGFNDCKTIGEVFHRCDNNNGFIVLLLNGKKLSYDIITGDEDANDNFSISAEGYLKQFYKDDEILEKRGANPKEIKSLLKEISEKTRFDSEKIIIAEKSRAIQ